MLFKKSVVTVLLLFFMLLGPLSVLAQALPIGDPSYHQYEPFDSTPTGGSYSGVGTVQGAIEAAFDGDLSTSIAFYYGATADGYVETDAFKKPSDNGLTDFTITWIDIKISYKATSTSANDDQYRIVAYVDPSPSPVVLQDWVTGDSAKYSLETGLQGNRAFSNIAEPNDGVWTWSDLASLRVQFETRQVGTNNFQRIILYEVWVSAYSSSYPVANTVSVQPMLIWDLQIGDVFYVDLYVTNVDHMWGYQILLEFNPDVLTAIEYFSYGPFVSAFPSEIGADYVAVAYSTYAGDLEGFTGSTPIARIYFVVNAYGFSVLHLAKADVVNAFGEYLTLTARDGVFASYPRHDVAVTGVSVNSTNVVPGEAVEINATVMNVGVYAEAFTVTAFYDSNPIDTQSPIELSPGASGDLTFVWDTSGVEVGFHQIKVEAVLATDENPADNVKIWSLVPEGLLVGKHDIAVTNIVRAYSNGTIVSEGELLTVLRKEIVYITATVTNLGDFPEIFNMTAVWQGAYRIGNITNVSLPAGTSGDFTFEWNTDITYPPWVFGFDRYGRPLNFSLGDIRVVAAPRRIDGAIYAQGVPYEKGLDYDYTADNDMTDGQVRVNRDLRYPTAKFTVNKLEPFVGEPAIFEGGPPAYSTTPSGTTIVNYRWDFGDGNVTEGNYPTITHAYTSVGSYQVNLTITNSLGLSSSIRTGMLGAPINDISVIERNIRILGIGVSPTLTTVGQSVAINVTIKNDCAFVIEYLAFYGINVTVYYDDFMIATAPGPWLNPAGTQLDTRTVSFSWDTSGLNPGTYTIRAVLDVLPYENSTADNQLTDGTVTLFQWDYEFTDNARGTTLKINLDHKFFQFVTPTKDYGLKQDPSMGIREHKVTIRFEDTELKLRSIIIDTKKTLCCARAEDIQTGETFWLLQRPADWTVGDVNYDGKVDVLDAATISAHWDPGPPSGPLGYDPNADINNDGVINVLDAAVVSAHWGQQN